MKIARTHDTKTAQTKTKPPSGKTKPRPEALSGQTFKVKSPFGGVFVTINENGHKEPFEIFINVGKAGSDIAADAEALGRLCSLLLRIPSEISEQDRVSFIAQHLAGIGGSRDAGFGPNRVRSVPDAVAIALRRYSEGKEDTTQSIINQEEEVSANNNTSGNLCPDCGGSTVKQEGCEKCLSACGWSTC
jgi:ribonucleoside-diphosphate reductase alpha chain